MDKLMENVSILRTERGEYVHFILKGEGVEDSLLSIYEILYICLKFEYLYCNISYSNKENKFFYAILGIICGNNQQRELIDDIIPCLYNIDKLNVDGLKNFALGKIKREWARYSNYCSVAYRLNYVDNEEKEFKILKNTYKPSDYLYEINLNDVENGIIGVDRINELLYAFSENFTNDIIFNVFALAPKKVLWSSKTISNEVVKFINEIFDN